MASNEVPNICNPDLDALINKAKAAQKIYATFSQEKVDFIFKAAATAADKECENLAQMAVAETGMGILKDKAFKNHFAADNIYKKYATAKTCGIISEDKAAGIKTVADPVGLIAGVIPTTNPTSTAIFKTLLALKTRNGIVISPHPRARKCTAFAIKIVSDAATEAGVPAGLLACIENPTLDDTNALMRHPAVDIILATGGPGMVKAAYSSGKPALGVGAGNTPAIIDETADVKAAVEAVLLSKTFDNGMICASEQSIVTVATIYSDVKEELIRQGAHILTHEESAKLGKIILTEKGVNAKIVGQPAHKIGQLAGVTVSETTRVLISEETSSDAANPYAHEKLSPVLALYKANNFEEAVETGLQLVKIGGLGHTAVLHTNVKNKQHIDYFATKIPACRLLINQPATHGAIGLCNSCMIPSLALGCGSLGGNSISENIGVKHLLNYKLVIKRDSN
ncbi:MAG: aldehyde dehydrogenase family protein [Puniceicoccales bacterium]|jgi:acetaldehyde dehydrogenase/alcohol dehydrogenase|nr:aldehyde dehydrogenase family protein [Puniceicoccales bacterium]